MTSPMSEDRGILREWAPLSALLQKIPLKLQSGLFFQDINFTCIDAVPEFIVVGTNHGLVYWFNRENGELQRFRCENENSPITCIKVTSTVDFMVATGSQSGTVTVFQIPKQPPDSLPDSLKPRVKKQVERFNISGLHKVPVKTVEWSKNGMKLFSGDQDGLVVMTEIDFYMHLSKSSELINERYSIVQLSYYHGLLLVSTVFRTILVDQNHNNKVTQVGQSERKSLGNFGASFCKTSSTAQQPIIYASRPGLRIWQADTTGTVLKTLIFKDAVKSNNTQVDLLNPAPPGSKKYQRYPSFGVILPFSEDLLVTHSEDFTYVVNPNTISITSVINNLRKITDVACHKDEIFILEGARNIVRISYHPESCSFDTTRDSSIDPLAAVTELTKPVTTGFFELTSKLRESSLIPSLPTQLNRFMSSNLLQSISVLPPVTIGVDVTSVVNAEEALEVLPEVPPIVPLDISVPLIAEIGVLKSQTISQDGFSNRKEIFQKISEQDFEEVVYTPDKKTKKHSKPNKQNLKSELLDSNKFNDNFNNKETKDNTVITTYSSLLPLSIDNESVLKAQKDIELIQKDVENKEKLLADVLSFDLSKYMIKSQCCPSTSSNNSNNLMDKLSCSEYTLNTLQYGQEENKNEDFQKEIKEDTDDDESEDLSYKTELKKLQDVHSYNKEKKLKESKNANHKIDNIKNFLKDEDKKKSEKLFNDLSKEFVMSTIEASDDWVLLG